MSASSSKRPSFPTSADVIVISDSSDDDNDDQQNDDNDDKQADDDDDEIELLGAAGPSSACINAQLREKRCKKGGANVVIRHTVYRRPTWLKDRRKERVEELPEARAKMLRTERGERAVRESYGWAAGGATKVEEEQGMPAKMTLEESVLRDRPDWELQRRSTSRHALTSDHLSNLPTPPNIQSPTSDSTSDSYAYSHTLIDHTPRAPGARPYTIQLIHHHPSHFSPSSQPFDIDEVPSFERGSWLSLCSHRYLVESGAYPTDEQSRVTAAEVIKPQLLRLFDLSGWPCGGEPRISFPVITNSGGKKFLDIRVTEEQQFEAIRNLIAVPRMGLMLKPFLHGAFVDDSRFLLLQFSHPRVKASIFSSMSTSDTSQLESFSTQCLLAISTCPRLSNIGSIIAMWLLPDGFPHNPELEVENKWERIPAYIVLIKRNAAPKFILPSHLNVIEAHGNVWIKLWWNDKPVDLCNYCKSALDGHTNAECTRASRRLEGGEKKLKYRPKMY
ncbi:protein kinase [Pseudozyma hubeiensis SY62]|uniref:Protein kinase n=1 Tax=Pseudozyma hubeiensis (strain SY62) TaxID=1305764 RepID=R9NWL5_PSEHS|nr:protein kinase [Pseudozyma hubeiensis SY62]GAC92896.1 protein kinase [Pseudozyma hubeiensis SY62]